MNLLDTTTLDVPSRGQPADYIISAARVQPPDVVSRGKSPTYVTKAGQPVWLRATYVFGMRQWQPFGVGRW